MLDYFLATRATAEGMEHSAVCGSSVAEVRRSLAGGYLGAGWADARVSPRTEPSWDILAPPLGRSFVVGGQECWSRRGHLLAGGTLVADYRGLHYAAVPRIYGEDRRVVEDGKPLTAIGEVELRCTEHPAAGLRAYLEPLDESHAVELLDGLLIEFDAGLPRGDGVVDTMA